MNISPFARLVKGYMAEKAVSLRELCREARIDPSFLSKVLSGKRNPPGDDKMLRRIARAMDMGNEEVFVASGLLPPGWRSIQKDRKLLKQAALFFEEFACGPAKNIPAENVRQETCPAVKSQLSDELL